MDTEKTTETEDSTEIELEEGEEQEETISLPKKEYDKLNQTLGALKKEVKGLKKTSLETSKEPQSTEPEYAKMAYLNSKGVLEDEDQNFVLAESKRLNRSLGEILSERYVKDHIQANKDARDAKQAMPKGGKRSGGATQHDVDYWLGKPGELPEDHDLAVKVVNARMKQESGKKFADVLYNEG